MKILAGLRRLLTPTFGFWFLLWVFAVSEVGGRLEFLGGNAREQSVTFLAPIYLSFVVPVVAMRLK